LPSTLGALAIRWTDLANWMPAGVGYAGVFINIPGLGSLGGIVPFVKLLALGLFIVWFAPNSQQFFGFVVQSGKKIQLFNWTVAWQAKPVFGFVLGCVFCLALSKLDKVSTFLYYQF
jgi:alginate O-acetyltransferase complex protein AlgI